LNHRPQRQWQCPNSCWKINIRIAFSQRSEDEERKFLLAEGRHGALREVSESASVFVIVDTTKGELPAGGITLTAGFRPEVDTKGLGRLVG
jgi:hypothetical protein